MLRVLAVLLQNELRVFIRNKISAFWSFAFPLFLFIVLFLAYGGGDNLGSVTVSVIDHDKSKQSVDFTARLKESVKSTDFVRLIFALNPDERLVPAGALRIVIPSGFHDADADTPAKLDILYGYSDGPATAAAARILQATLTHLALGVENRRSAYMATLSNTRPSEVIINYGQYLLGGVLVMTMMSAGIMSTTTVLAVMREHNLFRIYGCLPIPRIYFLVAILFVRLGLILIFSWTMIIIARTVFRIQIEILSPSLIYATALIVLGGILFLSIGLLLGSRVKTVATGTVVCNAVYFPLLFLSDLTFRAKALPDQFQAILAYNPVSQLAVALRAVLFQHAELLDLARLLSLLATCSITILIFAAWRFRWTR